MIYHYTSVNNLALILNYQSIRFTRLDRGDDVTEIEGLPVSLSTYAFVSCWTEDSIENIPLWKMYTDMKGVRICLPKDPFKKMLLPAGSTIPGVNLGPDIRSPFTLEELFSDQQMIVPLFQRNDSDTRFYKKIIYRNDYKNIYEDIIEISEDGLNFKVKDVTQIGMYKSDIWAFQKEARFTLYIVPLLPNNHPLVKGDYQRKIELSTQLVGNEDPELSKQMTLLDFIDVPLDPASMGEMQITLGPLTNLSDRIIVESLLAKFGIEGAVVESSLSGKIRPKV